MIPPFQGECDDGKDGSICDGLCHNGPSVTNIVSKRPRVLIPTLVEFRRKR